MVKLAVIADDLSGAGDSGLQFAKRGLRTVVLIDPGAAAYLTRDEEPDVVVLDTDSRQAPSAEAGRRVRDAAWAVRRLGAPLVYKKIDSTLRGNIGAELATLLDALPGAGAIVAPSYPAAGRSVVGGRLFVRGVELAASEFARDPIWPMTDSRAAMVVRRQSWLRVGEIPLDVVRSGAEAVLASAETAYGAGQPICVADAETAEDLACIARAIALRSGLLIGVGSAGLVEEYVEAFGLVGEEKREPAPGTLAALPALVAVGSVNPVSRRQLARVVADGAVAAQLQAGKAEDEAEVDRVSAEAVAAVRSGRSVALSLEGERVEEGESPIEASLRLAAALARAVVGVLAACEVSGLVLTGGDTARAVALALGARGLLVEREVLPGIPRSRLLGGTRPGLAVVTKAGGFGGPEALAEAVGFLQAC